MNRKRRLAGNSASLALTVFVSGAALIYAIFFFAPMRKSIAANRQKMNQIRSEIIEGDKLRLALRTMDDELQQAQEFNDQWRKPTPSALLPEITSAASRVEGLVLQRLDPHPPSKQLVASQRVEVVVAGPFAAIGAFLEAVEQIDPTHLQTTSLTLNAPEGDGQFVTCTATMSILSENTDFSEDSE